MDIDQHILQLLAAQTGGRPLTLGDMSRRFGASPTLVRLAARRLVDSGQAAPSNVMVEGVPTLRGLLPISGSATPV